MADQGAMPTQYPVQPWHGSALWLFDDFLGLEDRCMVKLIWDQSADISRLSPSLRSRLYCLSHIFSGMTPHQRLVSGCKMIACAGIDCAMVRSPSPLVGYECIHQIRSGMHAYSMAIGSANTYAAHVTAENVISSIKYFFTIPTREFYTTDKDFAVDLEHVIAGKAACLHMAWIVAIKEDISPWTGEYRLKDLFSWELCRRLSSTMDKRLFGIIRNVITPRGFDALRLTCVSECALDEAWIKTCTWSPGVHLYDTYTRDIVTDLCKAWRLDVVMWMLDNHDIVKYTNSIWRVLAEISVDFVVALVKLDTVDDVSLQHLYYGAFSNPDDRCLFYLVEQGLMPPDKFTEFGDVRAVALTGIRSHHAFLDHMTSTLGYSLLYTDFPDFLKFADVDCMDILLKKCGDSIVSDLVSNCWKLAISSTTLTSSMRTLKNVLDYLLGRLMATDPSAALLLHMLNMCRTLFVCTLYHVEESVTECSDTLKGLARAFVIESMASSKLDGSVSATL